MNSITVRAVFFVTIMSLLLFAMPVMADPGIHDNQTRNLAGSIGCVFQGHGHYNRLFKRTDRRQKQPRYPKRIAGDALQHILLGTGLTLKWQTTTPPF